MAPFLATTANPTHSGILKVMVTFLSFSCLSLVTLCDDKGSLQTFKIRKGLKLSYYSTDVDSFDLPTLDAYDFGASSFASPPSDIDPSILAPTPFAPVPMITSPPITAPTPSPYGASWTSGPPEYASSPIIVPPQNGPTQPMSPLPLVSPAGAPWHTSGPSHAAWCVARPTVAETQLQRAMDYACGTGADCESIQPNGHCYAPNNVVAHASYAFNNYWQRTRILGGTCDFGGTAMLINVDPSHNGCHFVHA